MNITSIKYYRAFILAVFALISSGDAIEGVLQDSAQPSFREDNLKNLDKLKANKGVPLNAKLPADIIDTLGTPETLKGQNSLPSIQESPLVESSENTASMPYKTATPSLNNRDSQAPIMLGLHRTTSNIQDLPLPLDEDISINTISEPNNVSTAPSSISGQVTEDSPFFPYQDLDSQLNNQADVIRAMPENTLTTTDLKTLEDKQSDLTTLPLSSPIEDSFLPSQAIDDHKASLEGTQDPVILSMPENTDISQIPSQVLNFSQTSLNDETSEGIQAFPSH